MVSALAAQSWLIRRWDQRHHIVVLPASEGRAKAPERSKGLWCAPEPSVHGQGSLLQNETEMGSKLTSPGTRWHPKHGVSSQVLCGVLGAPSELPKTVHSNFASPNIHPKLEGGLNQAMKVNRCH